MNTPENVNNLIHVLESKGYQAYAVGGCVRDSLLGREPKDWDICTSALPEQVIQAFNGHKVIETGIKHGTVTVLWGQPCEVTTFRLDGEYSDFRRPESVTFTADLTGDLSRRDFTINAMAYSPRLGIIDPFGGRSDLASGILRTVGEPEQRFGEDALRILRALRFAVVLGFSIDPATASAMLSCRGLLKNISAERVRAELMGALTGGKVREQFIRFRDIIAEFIPEIRPCFDFDQQTIHHCYDVYEHILTAVDAYEDSDPTIKIALLLHDIAKPQMYKFKDGSAHFKGHPVRGAVVAEKILRRLKFDNKTITNATALIRCHDVRLKGGTAQILKLASRLGDENMARLLPIMRADAMAQSEYKREEKLTLIENGENLLQTALKNDLCRSLSSLSVRGSDIAELGFKGRSIRAALHYALNGVMNGYVPNEREALLRYIDKFTKLTEV